MRSHCALYVDAGYLLASAATLISGTSLRSGINVNHDRLIQALMEQAEESSGLPLLRVNWYDSASRRGPDLVQERIGLLPRVKLRLGRLGYDGEQKGVDLRIGLDMVAHARNGAVDAIFLVSGDDDLTEAVEEAQVHGVQVIVLAVPNRDGLPNAVSRHLQRESDGVEVIDPKVFEDTVIPTSVASSPSVPEAASDPETAEVPAVPTPAMLAKPRTPGVPPPAPRRPTSDVVYTSATGMPTVAFDDPVEDAARSAKIDQVVDQVLNTYLRGAGPEQRQALVSNRPLIPRDVDRALLLDLCEVLDIYDLDDDSRYELRRRFWARYDEQSG